MTNIENVDRVEIWNSYLSEAKRFAEKLKDCGDNDDPSYFTLKGGTLPAKEYYIMMTVIHSALSIEARTNHLLQELREKNEIGGKLFELVLYSKVKDKWRLLPELVNSPHNIDYDMTPHHAISTLFKLRNKFVHISFERDNIFQGLTKNNIIGYYNQWIEAMEEMNVILERHSKKDNNLIKSLQVRI